MAYDLPSWLQADAPSEPWKALLAGVQAGSGIAQNINQGRALAQRKYEFDKMQEVQEGMRRYQLEEAGLHIEKMKLAKDYEFQTNRAAIEIGNLVNKGDPSSPQFIQDLYGIAARYPAVMSDPVFQHASELPKQASQLNLQKAQAYHQMNPAPANAADEAAISNQLAREEQVSLTTTGQPWTPEQRAKRAAELGQLKDFKPGFKGGIAFDDQGRIQQVTFGDQPTVATASMAQKNLNIAEKNYQLLDSLDKNLRDADLGVRGVLGEIVDRYAPQFGLPGFDPKRASNREVLKVSVQGMVRQISSDTRFTENDRKRAEDAMVTFGTGENKERATVVLRDLKDIIRSRARVDAETGGMPIPEFTMSPDEITKGVQSGRLTKEKGIELRLRYYPDIYGPTR
jgi:hypothetical protein